MQRTGIVRELLGDKAIVVIKRQSACGENCANCGGCTEKFNEITAENKIGALPGDTVTIEMSDKTVLSAAFLVYIVPLLIFFLGYAFFFGIGFDDGISALFGASVSALFYVFLYIKDKKDRKKYLHKIIEIN